MRESKYSGSSQRRHNRLELQQLLNDIQQPTQFLITNNLPTNNFSLHSSNVVSSIDNNLDNFDSGSAVSQTNQSVSLESITSSFISDTSSVNSILHNDMSLLEALRKWVVEHNVSHGAVRNLLTILKPRLNFLPSDPRTLLRTPRQLNVKEISGGQYVHFGLLPRLHYKISCSREEFKSDLSPLGLQLQQKLSSPLLSVSVGIDGIPITNSNTKSFWPILGKLDQLQSDTPFVIGIFCGKSKPADTLFLEDFVNEANELARTGVEIRGQFFEFRVSKILADAPARSFLKNINNHNGYSSCERCNQVGEWYGRIVFPQTSNEKRTDLSFKNKLDKKHHRATGVCVIENLDIGLVSQVPIDYMHNVCLGVTRKLFRQWVKGKIPHKLSNSIILEMSKRLLSFRKFIPKGFQRLPRGLLEIDNFKATEYRTLLLYTGVVCLKGLVSKNQYYHFLLLHCAMFILLSNKANIVEWNSVAKSLLSKFITEGIKLYGVEFAVYNVHNLLHLNEDARNFGNLDKASCFPFENFMQTIKRMLHSKNYPVEQVSKRIIEYENIMNTDVTMPCHSKPFKLSSKIGSNCYRLLPDRIVLISNYIELKGENFFVDCKEFKLRKDVNSYPLKSSNLGIYAVSRLSGNIQCKINMRDIICQCVVLPVTSVCDDTYYCFPLLHTIK